MNNGISLFFFAIFVLGCCPNDESVRSELAMKALSQAKEHVEAASTTMSRDEAFEPKVAARALVTYAIESGGLDGKRLAEAYALRASVHHSLGAFPLDETLMRQTVSDLNLAINLDSENLAYFFRRAMAYNLLDQHELAIDDYTFVLSLDPNSLGTQAARARVFFEIRDYDAAIIDFTAAIALDLDDMQSVELRGDSYKAIEEFRHAIDDYVAVKAWRREFRAKLFGASAGDGIDPSLIEIQTKIAVTYEKMGQLDHATNEYKEILAHDPNDPWAKARLESLDNVYP